MLAVFIALILFGDTMRAHRAHIFCERIQSVVAEYWLKISFARAHSVSSQNQSRMRIRHDDEKQGKMYEEEAEYSKNNNNNINTEQEPKRIKLKIVHACRSARACARINSSTQIHTIHLALSLSFAFYQGVSGCNSCFFFLFSGPLWIGLLFIYDIHFFFVLLSLHSTL